jgi:L-lactate dehydrogenase
LEAASILVTIETSSSNTSKVIIVGGGAVGSAYANALIMQDIADDIGIIDLNRERATADALDLSHSLTYSPVSTKRVYSAEYHMCHDADIVAICANAPTAQFDADASRMDLLEANFKMVKSITEQIMASGFKGIILVVTNPVDVISRVIAELSGLPTQQVIGTGTLIETARMRTIVAEYIAIDPRNIHGYVLGEHGDSGFTAWSNVHIGTMPLERWLENNPQYGMAAVQDMDERIRRVGFDIYRAKGATTFGIAGALARITRAILRNENVILPISTAIDHRYGKPGVFAGVPAVINRGGVRELVHLFLDDDERQLLGASVAILDEAYLSLGSRI